MSSSNDPSSLPHLDQHAAQALDVDLMSPEFGFSIDQLMELAGLSCASAIREAYPEASHPDVLVLCGPGNNGGDGLVCARHLHHFGYPNVAVSYPKFKAESALYAGLVTQLKSLGVEFVEADDACRRVRARECNVVVDAMFGFSFTGKPREPFASLIGATAAALQEESEKSGKRFAVAAVDIPSGWHVEDGDVNGLYPVHPHMLISLTAPKLCAKTFRGNVHYLGGRFVPRAIAEKYGLVGLPAYPGTSQCVCLSGPGPVSVENIRKTYDTTMTSLFNDSDGVAVVADDPMDVFDRWFADAQACSIIDEPNAMAVSSVNADHQPSTRFVLLRGFDRTDDRCGFKFFTNYGSRKGRDFAGAFLVLVSTTMMRALMRSRSRSHVSTTHSPTRQPGHLRDLLLGTLQPLCADRRPHRTVGIDLDLDLDRRTLSFTLTLTRPSSHPPILLSSHSLSDAESDAYWSSRPREHQLGALASAQSQPLGSDADLLARYDQFESLHPPAAGPIPRPDHWGGYVIVPHRIEFWQGRASRLHERLEYTRIERTWHTRRLAP